MIAGGVGDLSELRPIGRRAKALTGANFVMAQHPSDLTPDVFPSIAVPHHI